MTATGSLPAPCPRPLAPRPPVLAPNPTPSTHQPSLHPAWHPRQVNPAAGPPPRAESAWACRRMRARDLLGAPALPGPPEAASRRPRRPGLRHRPGSARAARSESGLDPGLPRAGRFTVS